MVGFEDFEFEFLLIRRKGPAGTRSLLERVIRHRQKKKMIDPMGTLENRIYVDYSVALGYSFILSLASEVGYIIISL